MADATKRLDSLFTHPCAQIIQDRFESYAEDRADWDTEARMDYDAWRRIYTQPWKEYEGNDWRSQIFVGATETKVRITAAILSEVLRGFPFCVEPSPYPESKPGFVLPLLVAQDRAKLMEKIIRDQLVRQRAGKTLISMILDLVVYGNVFTQCPVVLNINRRFWTPEYQGQEKGQDFLAWNRGFRVDQTVGFKHLNVWNVFMDRSGSGPQDCEGIGDRAFMTGGQFQRFAKASYGFRQEWVKNILTAARKVEEDDGPGGTAITGDRGPALDDVTHRPGNIEVFQYWGRLYRGEVEKWGASEQALLKDQYDPDEWEDAEDFEVGAVIASVGDRFGLVKLVRNPNAPFRPYQHGKFRVIQHETYGEGIPRGMRDKQAMLNSGFRAMIDNLAISANATGWYHPEAFEPWEDNRLGPGVFKALRMGWKSDRLPIGNIEIPNYTAPLMAFVEKMESLISEETIPNMLGGKTDQGAPKTAYGTSKVWEGASKLTSEPLFNLDEGVLSPMIEEFYHWNMMDPAVPQEAKGDYETRSSGFKAYQDTVLKGQHMAELMQLAFGNELILTMTNLKNTYKAFIRSRQEDPEEIMNDEQATKMMQDQLAAARGAAQLPTGPGAPQPSEPHQPGGAI